MIKKTSLTKCFSIKPRSSKLIFKKGNVIIHTGNRIFYPISKPPIKKLLLQHLLHINQGVQNCFSKQEMELSKQEMEIFLPLIGLWPKNFFYNIFSILTKEFKICFQNGKWNYPNRNWNYFSHFRASYKNPYFTKSFSNQTTHPPVT